MSKKFTEYKGLDLPKVAEEIFFVVIKPKKDTKLSVKQVGIRMGYL